MNRRRNQSPMINPMVITGAIVVVAIILGLWLFNSGGESDTTQEENQASTEGVAQTTETTLGGEESPTPTEPETIIETPPVEVDSNLPDGWGDLSLNEKALLNPNNCDLDNQTVASDGSCWDNWGDHLSVNEKVSINPYDCDLGIQVMLPTGICKGPASDGAESDNPADSVTIDGFRYVVTDQALVCEDLGHQTMDIIREAQNKTALIGSDYKKNTFLFDTYRLCRAEIIYQNVSAGNYQFSNGCQLDLATLDTQLVDNSSSNSYPLVEPSQACTAAVVSFNQGDIGSKEALFVTPKAFDTNNQTATIMLDKTKLLVNVTGQTTSIN